MANKPGTSFELRRDRVPVNNRWHYHREVELIYIVSGSGTLLTGNHVHRFSAGTMCIIGAGTPPITGGLITGILALIIHR